MSVIPGQSPQSLADRFSTRANTADYTQRLSALLRDLWRRVQDLSLDNDWTNASLLNSWAAYGTGYESPGYLMEPHGRVWLRGILDGSSAALSTAAFTLPSGYRPTGELVYPCMALVSTTLTLIRISVKATGDVVIGDGGSGAVAYATLDGISLNIR